MRWHGTGCGMQLLNHKHLSGSLCALCARPSLNFTFLCCVSASLSHHLKAGHCTAFLFVHCSALSVCIIYSITQPGGIFSWLTSCCPEIQWLPVCRSYPVCKREFSVVSRASQPELEATAALTDRQSGLLCTSERSSATAMGEVLHLIAFRSRFASMGSTMECCTSCPLSRSCRRSSHFRSMSLSRRRRFWVTAS